MKDHRVRLDPGVITKKVTADSHTVGLSMRTAKQSGSRYLESVSIRSLRPICTLSSESLPASAASE